MAGSELRVILHPLSRAMKSKIFSSETFDRAQAVTSTTHGQGGKTGNARIGRETPMPLQVDRSALSPR
jgi:hypothetical protein